MTLPIEYNPISLDNLQIEFGGNNPISLNEYYGYGNAPASGTISLGDFHQSTGIGSSAVTSGLIFELDARNSLSWPGSGSTWYDTTANNRDFSLINGPTAGTDSVVFDGSDDYMQIADGTWIPDGTTAVSVESYVKIDAWRTGQSAWITSKTSPSNQSMSWGFGESGGTITYKIETEGGGSFTSGPGAVISNPSSLLGTWMHCVLTYNGTTVKLYLNNSLLYTTTGSFHANTAPLRAMCFDPSNGPFAWPVDGEMRGLRMYNRELSAAEVSTNYSSWSGPITPTAATLSFSPTSHPGTAFTGTFNFDQNVGGFETGDVSVSGGSKGTFTKVSSSQYTLVITPSPSTGNVSVSVPANAAYTAANLGHNSISETVGYSSFITSGIALYLDAGNSSSYPGSGTTWTDLSGNGNNGTLTNGPTYSSANGGSIVFDGSDDQVNVSNSSSLNFTSAATLSAWFNFSNLPSGEIPLIRKEIQWQLGFVNSNTIRCLIYTNGTNGWTTVNDTSYTFSTGSWYNMVMTYNGSNMLIYVNNVLVKTATVTGSITATTNAVRIGYYPPNYIDGRISHCTIYDRALTATEVQQNFNALRGRYGI